MYVELPGVQHLVVEPLHKALQLCAHDATAAPIALRSIATTSSERLTDPVILPGGHLARVAIELWDGTVSPASDPPRPRGHTGQALQDRRLLRSAAGCAACARPAVLTPRAATPRRPEQRDERASSYGVPLRRLRAAPPMRRIPPINPTLLLPRPHRCWSSP
jgi:hypothetical protein